MSEQTTPDGAESPIVVERQGRVGHIRLNRPKALNALNEATMRAVVAAVQELDTDPEIGAILLSGSPKAFAAGADIKEMATKEFSEMYAADWFAGWDGLTRARTPIVACVTGYALGGGCELAMMADVLVAGEGAKFGQPEINLGVIPGMGGSQRLTRAVGKAKAMDMILTGRMMDAQEAERAGLVSRVVPVQDLMGEALKAAEAICSFGQVAVMAAKECVNRAFESALSDGVMHERRLFNALFATADQKEGMDAFLNKRPAQFANR